MATPYDNLYSRLGIPDYASAESIRKAYRKLALRFHPDRVQNEAHRKVSTAEFLKIQEAYEELTDPVKKSRYDQRLRAAELRLEFEEQQRQERARHERKREEREKRAYEKWQQEQLEREAMDEEQRQEQIRLAAVMKEWKRRDQSNKDFESGAPKKVHSHSAERDHHSSRVTDARADLEPDDIDDDLSRPRREQSSRTPLGFDQKAVPRRRPHVQPVVAPAYNPTPVYQSYYQQHPSYSYQYGGWAPHPQVVYTPPPTSPPQVILAPPSNPVPYTYANSPVYTSGRPEAAVRKVSNPLPGIQRRVSRRQVPRATRDELFHHEDDGNNNFRHESTHQYVDEQPKQRRRSFSFKETISREHASPPVAKKRQDPPPSSYRSPEPRHNQAGYESENDERRKTQTRTRSRDKHRRVSPLQSFAADAAAAVSPSPSPPPPKPRSKARRPISTTYKITINTTPDESPKVDRRKGT